PETISYSAILSIHDSIDMFMNLAAEKRGLNKRLYLMQHFKEIPELVLESSVEKINKRRNNLKHHGMIPGRIEIEDTCSVGRLFFEENAKIIFSKDFSDISLIDLVFDVKIKQYLKSAQALSNNGELRLAAIEVAKAYFHLLLLDESLNKYEKDDPWYNINTVPNIKGNRFYMKAMEKFFEGQEELFREAKTEDGFVEVGEGVAALAYQYNKAFSYVFQSLKVFSLGLDFKKYNHFNSFIPQALKYNTIDEKYEMGWPYMAMTQPGESLTTENIQFAIGFVLEFALKLQEFKY
ncbi:MAG: hypothetical protein WCF67_17455, partial [Chitinophagaceae bacterium]